MKKTFLIILFAVIVVFCISSCKGIDGNTSQSAVSQTTEAAQSISSSGSSTAAEKSDADKSEATAATSSASAQKNAKTSPKTSPKATADSPVSSSVSSISVKKTNTRILIVNTNLNADDLASSYKTLEKSVQECMPGAQVKTIHYEQLSLEFIAQYRPASIILGGQKDPWTEYPEDKLSKVCETIRNIDLPLLGICGGHQLIALSYGGKVDRIKVLDASKPRYEGSWREKGYVTITRASSNDIIFKGIKSEFQGFESHCDEVKGIPSGFVSIATGKDCKTQGMRHKSKPTYGVQFHPEVYDQTHTDGKIVLKNFLMITAVQ